MSWWEDGKDFQANGQAGVTAVISDKTDLKPKRVKKSKDGYCILTEGGQTIINTGLLNTGVPNSIKHY